MPATHHWIVILSLGLVTSETPATATLIGLERVSDMTDSQVTDEQEIEVPCPAGKVAISGGAFITGVSSYLVQNGPVGDLPTAWHALARSTSSIGWGLEVFVWCAEPPPSFERVGAVTDLDPAATRMVTASCPPGKRLVGVGGLVFGPYADKRLTSILPENSSEVTVAALDEGSGSWGLRADALCASNVHVFEIRSTGHGFQESAQGLSICPEGSVALYGGVRGPQSRRLSTSAPGFSGGSAYLYTIEAFEDSGTGFEAVLGCLSTPLFADGFETGDTSRW